MAGLCQFGETFVRGPPCRPSFSGRHAEQPFQPWRRRGAGPPKGRIEAKVSSSEAFNTATVEAAQVQARIKILRERFSIEEVDGEGMDGDVASQPVTNKPLKINMDLLLVRPAHPLHPHRATCIHDSKLMGPWPQLRAWPAC